jgi:hypothetical protein
MNGEPHPRTHSHRPDQFGHAALAALGGVAVGVILVLLTWLVVLLTRDDPNTRTTSTPSSAPAPPVSVTTRTVVVPSAPAPVDGTTTSVPARRPAIGDVQSLPGGLFCRDLKAKGYSYLAAIDYWQLHGKPDQMDADRNGIPCETVYPHSDVAAYWNGRAVTGAGSWPEGLFCRDLAARGATYAQAVAYWWYDDMPLRMDADKNGIPCETVYSSAAVNAFWRP